MPSTLFERLLRAAEDTRMPLSEALRGQLAHRLDAAEAATPSVVGDPHHFCAALLAQLNGAPDAPGELARLHVEDMYFVWALANQERSAVLRFEREFLAPLRARVAEARELAPGELEQHVRSRLLLGEGDQPPRITQYGGRGPFRAWLRMVGKRVALDLLRACGKVRMERELESPGVATDPELDFLKLRHAADFKHVLEQALARLSARQVTLLKLSYLEELPPSAIGVMYGVSSRTVQRWLAELKDEVLRAVRAGLKERLALSPSELDSLVRLMQSQLHVSLRRVLGPDWAL